MKSYTYVTLPVIGEYDGQVKQQKLLITNRPAGSDRCCGRTAGAWSFQSGSCSNKGKYVYADVQVEVTGNGEPTVETRTVQFCGTHDPVRKANKARDEYLRSVRERQEADKRYNAAQLRVNELVEQINQLAGDKVVEASWGHYSRQPEVRLRNATALLAILEDLTEKETAS